MIADYLPLIVASGFVLLVLAFAAEASSDG